MLTERRRAWIISSLVIVLFVGGVVFLAGSSVWTFITSPEKLRDYVRGFGAWAPIVITLIHIGQVIIAPVPGQAIDIANGYLFGPLWGPAVSMLGISIGSIAAIVLARTFGRPLVEKLITPAGMKQVLPFTRRRTYWFFFVLFLVPGTPDDLICFAIGLTSIPLRHAIGLALLGRAPGVIAASLLGASGNRLSPLSLVLLAIVVPVVFSLIMVWTPLQKKLQAAKSK